MRFHEGKKIASARYNDKREKRVGGNFPSATYEVVEDLREENTIKPDRTSPKSKGKRKRPKSDTPNFGRKRGGVERKNSGGKDRNIWRERRRNRKWLKVCKEGTKIKGRGKPTEGDAEGSDTSRLKRTIRFRGLKGESSMGGGGGVNRKKGMRKCLGKR